MKEMWVCCLGLEDPLEKGMATHSDILACKIPWTEGAQWATVYGVSKESDMTERLNKYNANINEQIQTSAPTLFPAN